MPRPHIFVEFVGFVHPICFCLFRIQPSLQEFSVILCKRLISFFHLTEFQKSGADFVM